MFLLFVKCGISKNHTMLYSLAVAMAAFSMVAQNVTSKLTYLGLAQMGPVRTLLLTSNILQASATIQTLATCPNMTKTHYNYHTSAIPIVFNIVSS